MVKEGNSYSVIWGVEKSLPLEEFEKTSKMSNGTSLSPPQISLAF